MHYLSRYANGEISWSFKDVSTIAEETGELGVLEFGKELDFIVKRVFYVRCVKNKAIRGLHSHKELKQLIVCVNGEFTIELDNGCEKYTKRMISGKECLYLDGKVWRIMKDFTEDAVAMVLCDREYKYDEVVRDYSIFLKNLEQVNNEI